MRRGILMKLCPSCGETKPLTMFHKKRDTALGVTTNCKKCVAAKDAERYRVNPELSRLKTAVWVKNNPDKVKEARVAWRGKNAARYRGTNDLWFAANKEKSRLQRLAWDAENVERVRQAHRAYDREHPDRCVQHRVAKCQAQSKWANKFFLSQIYDLAVKRSRITNKKWHVDHIIPLKSPIVCGLHTESNLRVIDAVANTKKGNRVWPDMP